MKKSEKKYYILYIKGNRETVIGEFANETDARSEFLKIKQKSRKRTGVFQLLRAVMLSDGELSVFNRDPIEAYYPEIEAFLQGL